jgi:amiloride-sensitive sodium channel subunit alpha/amiloride-sensitive sodium channel subunit gamma
MSLNVKSITETARYNFATFISTIGGSMGAWVGFSFCMVFEMVELVIDLAIKIICCDGAG